jgi:hypothetical protein
MVTEPPVAGTQAVDDGDAGEGEPLAGTTSENAELVALSAAKPAVRPCFYAPFHLLKD